MYQFNAIPQNELGRDRAYWMKRIYEELYEKMRILLTGFKGFIGKNVHKTLLEKYDNIISLCCIEKDYITDQFWPTRLSRAVIDCDVILHIGAISDTMLKDCNEMLKI